MLALAVDTLAAWLSLIEINKGEERLSFSTVMTDVQVGENPNKMSFEQARKGPEFRLFLLLFWALPPNLLASGILDAVSCFYTFYQTLVCIKTKK